MPITQGQRIDLLVTIRPEGGAFPILAQMENARMRTAVNLATPRAKTAGLPGLAKTDAPYVDQSFEAGRSALLPQNAPPMRC